MNAKLRAILLPILRNVRSGKSPSFRNRSAAEQAIFLLGKRSTKGKKASAARKSEKRAQHQDSTASIREAVFQRAGEWCEARPCRFSPIELDHWLGGSGRRREQQTVETCWALCQLHHRARTKNIGSARYWNEKFREHCERFGYPVLEHIVHEPLTRKAAP